MTIGVGVMAGGWEGSGVGTGTGEDMGARVEGVIGEGVHVVVKRLGPRVGAVVQDSSGRSATNVSWNEL